MKILKLFSIISFLLFSFNSLFAQNYSEYLESRWTDLSFEGMALNEYDELAAISNYFMNLETDENRNLIEEYSPTLLAEYYNLIQQKAVMSSYGFTCENLRLSNEEIQELSQQEQQEYFSDLFEILDQFEISDDERDLINTEINNIMPLSSNVLARDLTIARCYFENTECLRYTKLEVFRDATGYCDPEDWIENYKSPNYENDGFPLFFKRAKQGLSATQSVQRLLDLSLGTCQYINQNSPNSQSFVQDANFNKSIVDKKVFIYPNPIRDKFNLQLLNFKDDLVSISIYNINGVEIIELESEIINSEEKFLKLQLPENLETGIYLCHIQSPSYENVVKLLINSK